MINGKNYRNAGCHRGILGGHISGKMYSQVSHAGCHGIWYQLKFSRFHKVTVTLLKVRW